MPPFKLRKAPKRNLYWVVDDKNKHYSKEPMPKEHAKQQQKALYAAYGRKLKGGVNFVVRELEDEGQTYYYVEDTDPYTQGHYNPQLLRQYQQSGVYATRAEAEEQLRRLEDQVVDQSTAAVLRSPNVRQYESQRRMLAPIAQSPTGIGYDRPLESSRLLGRFTGNLASRMLASRSGSVSPPLSVSLRPPNLTREGDNLFDDLSPYQNRSPTQYQQPPPVHPMLSSNVAYIQPQQQIMALPLPSGMRMNLPTTTTTTTTLVPSAPRRPTTTTSNIGRTIQFTEPQQTTTLTSSTMPQRASPKTASSSSSSLSTPTSYVSPSSSSESPDTEDYDSTPTEQGDRTPPPKRQKTGKGILKKRANETELEYQGRLIRTQQQEDKLKSKGITPDMKMAAIAKSNIERKKQQLKDIESQLAVERAYENDPEVRAKREAIKERAESNKVWDPILKTLVDVGDVVASSNILPKPLAMAYEAFRPDVEGEQAQQQMIAEERQRKEAFGQQYSSQLEQQAQKLKQELGVGGAGRFGAVRYFGE